MERGKFEIAETSNNGGENMNTGISLFEVELKNHVIKKITCKPIPGQQGRWYPERCLVIAKDRAEIFTIVSKMLSSRRVIGNTRNMS